MSHTEPSDTAALKDALQRAARDVDQSGSVSRVDPSGLPGGGDPSGAVVELPDAAIEAVTGPVSVGAVRDAAAAMIRWCDDPTASPTVLGSILVPLVPAVRAEAVADERVAVVAELEAAGHLAAANLIAVCGGPTFDERIAEAVADERQRIAQRLEAVLNTSDLFAADAAYVEAAWQLRSELLSTFAAGSVPVATPQEEWRTTTGRPLGREPRSRRPITRHICGCVTGWDDAHEECVLSRCSDHGPVATPTEPAPGSDEAYRLQQRLQAENRLVATLHGRSDPCTCGDCAASPVPAVQPEQWFRETPESLAMLDDVRAEVAAVEAAAEQPEER